MKKFLVVLTFFLLLLTGCGEGGTGSSTVSGTQQNTDKPSNSDPSIIEPTEPTDNQPAEYITSARGDTPPLPILITE